MTELLIDDNFDEERFAEEFAANLPSNMRDPAYSIENSVKDTLLYFFGANAENNFKKQGR